MRVAGLDLSLRAAGVAVLVDGQAFTYTFGSALKRDASLSKQVWRNIEIANGVVGVLKRHHVEAVGVEDYAFSRKSASVHSLAELGGLIKAQLMLAGIGCPMPLPSSSIRKFLFGKNISDKDLIRTKLAAIGHVAPKNTDESDALAVALVIDAYKNNRSKYSREHEIDLFLRLDQRTAACTG